ncbi:ATP-grasp domain-containing protein [Paenibacillus sp. BAC0078]
MRKILLSEGSSLTSRETITVLRNHGYIVDVLSSSKFPISAFSIWRHKVISTINLNEEPKKYLSQVSDLAGSQEYLAILPTHEEAWLFAEGENHLPADMPVAVASSESFQNVQGKVAFAELADELQISQPCWLLINKGESIDLPFPYWIKSDFGTAGRSVYKVHNSSEKEEILSCLCSSDNKLMAQENINGQYGQVQAVFNHGVMVAVHTSIQQGVGAGGSAAARLSVDYPQTRDDISKIGKHLNWHGGLTLDFIYQDEKPYYIECNPRMVEPANAERAGVNFPEILIHLASGNQLPRQLLIGRAGVKTHSTMALLLGTAERTKSRVALLRMLGKCITLSGCLKDSVEVLTPVFQDPLSIIPLVSVLFRLLVNPHKVKYIANIAVQNYSVSPETIKKLV